MRLHPRFLILVSALSLLRPHAAPAQVLVPGFTDSIIAQNLDLPVGFDFLPDGRVVFVEQYSGKIRLIVNGHLSAPDPVATLPGVRSGGERGLLGIAVDPLFPARPYFYTHMTATDGFIRIQRWTVSGDLNNTGSGAISVDPASRFDLLTRIPDQASNHNGGTVRFGTDGMLYVSVGDDAQNCSATQIDSLKGKILRLRVSTLPPGPGAASFAQITPPDNPYVARPDSGGRLVYAYGLRNPFRFQVDTVRSALVIGDVGLDTYEEIDLLALPGASGSDLGAAGSNFGWPWFEGDMAYLNCGQSPVGWVHAAYIFDRTSIPGASLISAGAYHRKAGGTANFPNRYEGDILFSDYASGGVYRLESNNGVWSIAPADSGQADPDFWATGFENVSDWRVGPDGALWACRQSAPGTFRNTGSIERIAYVNPTDVPPGTSSFRLALSAFPVPASGPVTLALRSDPADEVRVRVYDVRGRLVRDLPAQRPVAWSAVVHVSWDGLDDDGREAPNGVYWARAQSGGKDARCGIVLAR